MTYSTHQPLPEGEEPWLHRLPRARVVHERGTWITETVRGQSVAHLGFADVGCELSRGRHGSWLHQRLAVAASKLVGLDVAARGVSGAREQGYEAYEVDCTDRSDVHALGLEPFDVVLAGELIEHVDNPAGLLEAATELSSRDGTLIITTPNARRLMDVMLAAVRREVIHPDHVAVYSIRTLSSMLKRHGWQVIETLVYMNPRTTRRPKTVKELFGQLGHELERALTVTVSPYLADGLIVVARQCRTS